MGYGSKSNWKRREEPNDVDSTDSAIGPYHERPQPLVPFYRDHEAEEERNERLERQNRCKNARATRRRAPSPDTLGRRAMFGGGDVVPPTERVALERLEQAAAAASVALAAPDSTAWGPAATGAPTAARMAAIDFPTPEPAAAARAAAVSFAPAPSIGIDSRFTSASEHASHFHPTAVNDMRTLQQESEDDMLLRMQFEEYEAGRAEPWSWQEEDEHVYDGHNNTATPATPATYDTAGYTNTAPDNFVSQWLQSLQWPQYGSAGVEAGFPGLPQQANAQGDQQPQRGKTKKRQREDDNNTATSPLPKRKVPFGPVTFREISPEPDDRGYYYRHGHWRKYRDEPEDEDEDEAEDEYKQKHHMWLLKQAATHPTVQPDLAGEDEGSDDDEPPNLDLDRLSAIPGLAEEIARDVETLIFDVSGLASRQATRTNAGAATREDRPTNFSPSDQRLVNSIRSRIASLNRQMQFLKPKTEEHSGQTRDSAIPVDDSSDEDNPDARDSDEQEE